MSGHKKTTTDVWFAAFLQEEGNTIVGLNQITRGKAEFIFELSNEEWTKLKLAFHNSDVARYKLLISQLKDLAY